MSNRRHIVGIIGGAVAGSEAAALCADHRASAVVLEQGSKPYGKIEDGLPRWHEKLREKEYGRIDGNLTKDGVRFVPCTRVGRDVTFAELADLGFSAVILANGAWRDRPLPVPGIEKFVGKGLLYQNPFVYWFNHKHEKSYSGPTYEAPQGAIVVGGGLASIDVAKILSLESHAQALRAAGHEVETVELEMKGIPAWADKNGVDLSSLNVVPPTLYYRRGKEDMPLASPPENATEAQREKTRKARAKIMDRVIERYCVRFAPYHSPLSPIEEDGRLAGLVFQRTEVVDGRVKPIEGETVEVRAPLVISSIGSVPESIEGIPMKGELYDFADWRDGSLKGREGVFGLGNVLTGKGNIKDSRSNAQAVARNLLDAVLGVDVDDTLRGVHDKARQAAEPVVERALEGPDLDDATIARIDAWVKSRWAAVGYEGDYAAWIKKARQG